MGKLELKRREISREIKPRLWRLEEKADNTATNVTPVYNPVVAKKEVDAEYERLANLFPDLAAQGATLQTLLELELKLIREQENPLSFRTDTKTELLHQIAREAAQLQEAQQLYLHNLDIYNRVAKPYIDWTPFGSFMDAGVSLNLDRLGLHDLANLYKISGAMRAPLDILGLYGFATAPLSSTTGLLSAYTADKVAEANGASPGERFMLSLAAGAVGGGGKSMYLWSLRNFGSNNSRLAATMRQSMLLPDVEIPYNTSNNLVVSGETIDRPIARFIFSERPSTLSFAERLGIPKGERNNFNVFLKQALVDLENYIKSGLYRLTLYIDPKTKLISYEPKDGYVTLTPELVEGKTSAAITPEGRGTYDINFRNKVPNVGISEHKNLLWIPEFNLTLGEVEMFGGRFAPYNFRLTAPRTDALHLVAETPEEILLKTKLVEEASPRINKNVMKDFWTGVSEVMRPSSYLSADAGKSPLGFNMITIFKNGRTWNRNNDGTRIPNKTLLFEDILKFLRTKTKWTNREEGLSTDSYLALLKQAARENSPYELRYSPDGFTVFNSLSFDNKFISDLLIKAQKGEIPKEDFLKAFHDWVAPYNGMDAKIVNGEIVIPHPFLYKRKLGGKIY